MSVITASTSTSAASAHQQGQYGEASATATAGGSGGPGGGGEGKRKRRRSRKRKGLRGEGENEVDEGSEQGGEDDKGEKATAVAAETATSATDPKPVAEKKAVETDDDGDADGDEDDEEKKKKRRKRSRRKKGDANNVAVAGNGEVNGSEAKQDPVTAASQAPSNSRLHLEKQLKGVTDPSQDASLNDSLQKALAYAYVFHTARSSWKFAKAKEGWLLRHLLTPPPAETPSNAGTVSTTTGRTDTVSESTIPAKSGEGEEDTAAGSTHIPDTYVPLVGKYLSTMQGKGKERLRGELEAVVLQASQLPDEVEPDSTSATATEAVAVSASEVNNDESAAKGSSVRFAEMADEDNAREADPAVAQRQLLRWKATRAKAVLPWLQ